MKKRSHFDVVEFYIFAVFLQLVIADEIIKKAY